MKWQQTDLWWRFTAIKKIWQVRSSDNSLCRGSCHSSWQRRLCETLSWQVARQWLDVVDLVVMTVSRNGPQFEKRGWHVRLKSIDRGHDSQDWNVFVDVGTHPFRQEYVVFWHIPLTLICLSKFEFEVGKSKHLIIFRRSSLDSRARRDLYFP